MTKICSKCKLVKNLSEFTKDSHKKDGLRPDCRDCTNAAKRDRYPLHKEKHRKRQDEYDKKNSERLKIAAKKWMQEHKEEQAIKRKSYFASRKAEKKEYDAEYHSRPEVNRKRRDTHATRIQQDVQYKIQHLLRNRLTSAVKRGAKAGSAVRDLGCGISEFKTYLESKFKDGMTWDNWGIGYGKWNIDHIIPVCAFNLEDRQHVVLVCHYLNLQPLWFEENLSKGGKYPTHLAQQLQEAVPAQKRASIIT